MAKKKNKKNHGTKNQQNQQIQQPTEKKEVQNVQNEAHRDVVTNTDCTYYRKRKDLCALGVAPTHCDACNAYITLQIIKKKKAENETKEA